MKFKVGDKVRVVGQRKMAVIESFGRINPAIARLDRQIQYSVCFHISGLRPWKPRRKR